MRESRLREVYGLAQDYTAVCDCVWLLGLSVSRAYVLATLSGRKLEKDPEFTVIPRPFMIP